MPEVEVASRAGGKAGTFLLSHSMQYACSSGKLANATDWLTRGCVEDRMLRAGLQFETMPKLFGFRGLG